MERLTIRTDDGVKVILPGLQIPYTIQEIAEHYKSVLDDVANKLAAYEDAEENGTLIRLPIKPGTPVWVLEKKADHKTMFIRERFVNSYGFSTDGYMNMQLMVPEGSYPYPVDDIFCELDKIGKTVFLSEPEARKALEGMK